LEQVEAAIRSVPRVQDVHDLHIWSLGVGAQALTCHVRIPPLPFADGEVILGQVNALLERRFRIRHATVQLECEECAAVNGCHLPGARCQVSGSRLQAPDPDPKPDT
jgi:cobalt-zinc-cadmium efflux system protein